ncbi:uncharacterized protein GLRG_08901 [Colletotrichum graminicola M1.001]|uniref:DUF7888 domain-containing protein n=1 Tax=Colletotrichum graminicola (strain M1.001 / M2 / FGSC 10212) TaxID=645133 RepID=E3QSD0_COLGM|nr:uncharacterized protein GLRG_08901 [Colletotrichum graminicola M1.001]EFQ33757.1 hypothetical protein GLRG_08901 [Colletotrichum graminicola M1.001]
MKMRVSKRSLFVCCISGVSLVAALPSSLGVTFTGVRSVSERQAPKPEIIQRQPAAAQVSAPPPNAQVPPSESAALVDGQAVTKRSASKRQDDSQSGQFGVVPVTQDPGAQAPLPPTNLGPGSTSQGLIGAVIAIMFLTADAIDRSKSFKERTQMALLDWYNYDCMYLEAPNQFFTDSDGGSINRLVRSLPLYCVMIDAGQVQLHLLCSATSRTTGNHFAAPCREDQFKSALRSVRHRSVLTRGDLAP